MRQRRRGSQDVAPMIYCKCVTDLFSINTDKSIVQVHWVKLRMHLAAHALVSCFISWCAVLYIYIFPSNMYIVTYTGLHCTAPIKSSNVRSWRVLIV